MRPPELRARLQEEGLTHPNTAPASYSLQPFSSPISLVMTQKFQSFKFCWSIGLILKYFPIRKFLNQSRFVFFLVFSLSSVENGFLKSYLHLCSLLPRVAPTAFVPTAARCHPCATSPSVLPRHQCGHQPQPSCVVTLSPVQLVT